VADRLHIAYRFRSFEAGRGNSSSSAFCTLADGKIASMDLVCSGFRPLD
jgi:hypothetical protein